METKMTELVKQNDAMAVERVLVDGDLSLLTPMQRVEYLRRLCDSLGVNHLTRPFRMLKLNGQLQAYATKDLTEQLRKIHRISLSIVSRTQEEDGTYEVITRATMPDGRSDEDTGVVCLTGLKGEALSNARMKASTKSKRRVTLSICGLSVLDESEISSVPTARVVNMTDDGEIIPEHTPEQKAQVLLVIHDGIDAAESVNDLMAIYQSAADNPIVDAKTLSLVKSACGKKRKMIEEVVS